MKDVFQLASFAIIRLVSSGLLLTLWSLAGQAQAVTPQVISLEEAISIAITANPEVSSAVAGQQQAKAKLQSVRSGLLPKIGAAEQFSDSTDPVFAFGTRLRQGRFTATDFSPSRLNYPPAAADFTSSLGATWNVFDSGRTVLQVRGARSDLAASELRLNATKENIAYQVIRSYYRALLADQEKLTTAAAVSRARSFATDAHNRVNTGMALSAEGMQADIELAQREQEAEEAESNVALAYAELGGVLGDPSKQWSLVQPAGNPTPVAISLEELEKNALKNRPDLAARRSAMAASADMVRASRRANGPSLSAFANVQADNPHLATGGNTNWTVGAKAELLLFDGGQRRAATANARAALSQATAASRRAEIQAQLEVKQAYYAVQTAQRQYQIADEVLAKTKEILRTYQDRYDAGLVTITEVLGQQQQLRLMEVNRAESLYKWWTAAAELRLATGEETPVQASARP